MLQWVTVGLATLPLASVACLGRGDAALDVVHGLRDHLQLLAGNLRAPPLLSGYLKFLDSKGPQVHVTLALAVISHQSGAERKQGCAYPQGRQEDGPEDAL